MKVLLVNGSPNQFGCTYTALSEVAKTLEEEGIGTKIYYIGHKPVSPCADCRKCATLHHCVVIKDGVNEFLTMAREYDGYVLGSPVHYASASGAIVPFMDRVFFADYLGGFNSFKHKPAAAVVSARRAGTTATLDQLNKYFQIQQMPIISGRYWNMVHGANPEQVKQDLEGMQNMRILGRNMAYWLHCQEIAKAQGLQVPTEEETVYTNFIR